MAKVVADNNGGLRLDQVRWSDEEQVSAFIRGCARQKQRENMEFELATEMSLAWYRGQQWLFRRPGSQGLTKLVNRDGRARVVYNKILEYVEATAARLSLEPIRWEVLPATGDLADIEAARLGTAVLSYYAELLRLERLESRVDRWILIAGESYVRVTWDPDRGPRVDLAAEYGGADAFRAIFGARPPRALGDIDIAVLPVYNVYWGPPGAPWEEAEWVLEISERTRAYVSERYGVDPDELGAGERPALVRPRHGPGRWAGVSGERQPDRDSIPVHTLWIPRGAPTVLDGRHAVLAGDKLLVNEPMPYDHGEVPIVQFRSLGDPTNPHGMSYVQQLMGPQADLNRNMSQQIEARETMASPRIIAQRGSIQEPELWSGAAGGINEYVGTPPMVWQGAGMPSSVLINLQQTIRAMQDIMGLHDVSQARVPAGVKSGVAIRALQEADAIRLGELSRERRASWERVGRLALQTIAQYVTEERLVRIAGDEGKWETARFRGRDLIGGQAYTEPGISWCDVRVRTTGLPLLRSTQAETIASLVRAGFLRPTDPRDRQLVFDALQLGAVGGGIDPARDDRDRARAENGRLLRGEPAEVRDFDDHDVHIAEHDRVRKREPFRAQPVEIQAAFQHHVHRHRVEAAKRALRVQMVMAEAQRELGAESGAVAPAVPAAGGGLPGADPALLANLAAALGAGAGQPSVPAGGGAAVAELADRQ